MRKFVVKSEQFTGFLVFGYSDLGTLSFYQNEAQMKPNQLTWLFTYFPLHYQNLKQLKGERGTATITEIPADLSFEAFWSTYNHKIHPAKCKPEWAKLPDEDRGPALVGIHAYDRYLVRHPTIVKANPLTYLRGRYWETDWDKVL